MLRFWPLSSRYTKCKAARRTPLRGRRGATLGILAADGVYIITGGYTLAANAKLIEFVAWRVVATGEITERDGHRTIRVLSIKRADK